MKSSIKWVAVAVILIGVIVGATLLYNNLSQNNEANNLIVGVP